MRSTLKKRVPGSKKKPFQLGPASSVEERSLRKKSYVSSDRGSNLAICQVFSCAIYSQLHDPEASKHVGKYLATSQSETKLAAVNHSISE